MDYHKDVILDFAKRTRANLEFIDVAKRNGGEVFEFTQLANSMLGLLVFPQQEYFTTIPETPLDELAKQGWPSIKVTIPNVKVQTLRQLMRMLRNGISHCNVTFLADDEGQIAGLRIWNTLPGQTQRNWEAELSRSDLRTIALKFIELMEITAAE